MTTSSEKEKKKSISKERQGKSVSMFQCKTLISSHSQDSFSLFTQCLHWHDVSNLISRKIGIEIILEGFPNTKTPSTAFWFLNALLETIMKYLFQE